MKKIHTFIWGIALLLSYGCQEGTKVVQEEIPTQISTFYFIRHAEKDRSDPEDLDPELNQKGLGRAMHWAEILDDVRMDAIYTTDYERATMTAAPISVKQDITVQYYDPESIDIEQFKRENQGKNVLVVGHSNTTPDLVNQMIGEERYAPMDDTDNGSLFIVQLFGNKPAVSRLHFSCNCPD